MRRFGLILLAAILHFAVGVSAAHGGKDIPAPPLHLVSEYTYKNPYGGVSWCLGEDDWDQRNFYGSLTGSYSTSFVLCDYASDGYDAGGIGVYGDVYIVGHLDDMTITSPSGVTHHAVLVGTTVTGHGTNTVTTYHYQVCFVPPFSLSTGVGTNPLRGGEWEETLSGQIVSANQWTATAQMSYVQTQQSSCPLSEQNLTP